MKSKITLKDFQKLKDEFTRQNEVKKVYGIAGTGKTTYMANLIKEKIREDKLKNILILSYSHSGKNELFKKLTGKELGKINKRNFKIKVNDKEANVSAMTFFSFINLSLKTSKNLEKDYIINTIQDPLYYLKTKEFEEFIRRNNLKVRIKFLLQLLNLLKLKEEGINYQTLIENKIAKKLLLLSKDELYLLIIFLENNIFQHINTYVYDYLNNRKYPLHLLILTKWESLLRYNLDLKEILELKNSILEEFPLFNVNSFLIDLIDKIEKNNERYLPKLDYDLVVIDEAQDTPDYMLKFLFKVLDTDELYLVGDPAQNIYFDLGYSEVFTKFDKNAIILKDIYRYSKELKYFVLEKYPNFDLMWKTRSRTDFETCICDIKEEEIEYFIREKNIFVKNTNKVVKTKGGDYIYLLFLNAKDSVIQWFKIMDNIKYYFIKAVNKPLLKKWLMRIPKIYKMSLIEEIKDGIKKLEDKEKVLFLIDSFENYNKEEDFPKFYSTFIKLKELVELPKYKLKKVDGLFIYALFNNTYQSKGRSYPGVIYYNEFGKYYLMKKHLEDNVFWRFYHATLEYVAYTRAMKRLYIVEK